MAATPALLMSTSTSWARTAAEMVGVVEGEVTSSSSQMPPCDSNSGWDFRAEEGERAVPMTLWPDLRAARAMCRPRPEEEPVIRKVWLLVGDMVERLEMEREDRWGKVWESIPLDECLR